MAVTVALYNSFLQRKLDESTLIALANDAIRLILTSSAYVPDLAAHVYRSSVTSELATANGYTAGGQTLGGKVVGWDGTGNFAYFDANDVVWDAPCTFTARRGILFKDTGVSGTSPLIGYIDFGADKVATGGIFAVRWAAPSSGAIVRIRRY
jgi:hypothetical protein